ncbi:MULTISPECIES: NAD(P)H-dependent oxidoreductase [Streptomyces]|uniref:NAD(P)H-dependent oxidoreductase n=1 Tax=Streptomyces TaxID=1883 RepID=UPI00163C5A7C|nr:MULTISPECIES: NAD(P)H-dependent oxidoreductase [Streptomyces]MBC2874163.1 NAD(P)H-dependent oxidoreductase [Streptomyces sp. TYQ1024]UBI40211.1 NAD(P)H-dependent oxidoreductase [Streptomyces mobaraensis]UKW32789.1 NAD(P)H-dependent oxidoreductase [Streptomyces sp. TYQ1024]
MDATTPSKSALIVHAHPEPGSFSTSQMRVAAEELRRSGHSVRVVDLYADGWAPVLDRHEFGPVEGHFKPQAEQRKAVREGTLPVEVRAHLDAVLDADLLVLSFPLWWFSVPAILKGWIDRVFAMGAVFGGDHGVFDRGALRGKRAMVLVTTGGTAESFARGGSFGAMDDFLYHIRRGMLEFVGYEVLPPVVTYGPAHMTDADRLAALEAVRETFAETFPVLKDACPAAV